MNYKEHIDILKTQKEALDKEGVLLENKISQLTGSWLKELGYDPNNTDCDLSYWGWGCENSPTSKCIYVDRDECCVICGDPEERK